MMWRMLGASAKITNITDSDKKNHAGGLTNTEFLKKKIDVVTRGMSGNRETDHSNLC